MEINIDYSKVKNVPLKTDLLSKSEPFFWLTKTRYRKNIYSAKLSSDGKDLGQKYIFTKRNLWLAISSCHFFWYCNSWSKSLLMYPLAHREYTHQLLGPLAYMTEKVQKQTQKVNLKKASQTKKRAFHRQKKKKKKKI